MTATHYKIITVISVALLAGSVFWGMNQRGAKDSAYEDLNKQKLKTESILSEKLSVEKDRDKLFTQVAEVNRKNTHLSEEIESITKRLSDNEAALRKARAEQGGAKKKVEELTASRQSLEHQLGALKSEMEKLQQENQQLGEARLSLASQNEKLKLDLLDAQRSRYDRPLVEATRGSQNKLVAKASRVQKLKATLSLAADAGTPQFTVMNPKGIALSEKEGTMTSRVISSSATNQLVEMTFTAKKKLLPGLYQIEVRSGSLLVGSLQAKLR